MFIGVVVNGSVVGISDFLDNGVIEIGDSVLVLDLGVVFSEVSWIVLGYFDVDYGLVDLELFVLEFDGCVDIVLMFKVLIVD